MKTQGSNIPNANADAENLDIYGNGVLVLTLSADQYMQRLGRWFLQGTNGQNWVQNAISTPEWSSVLPNWQAVKGWGGDTILQQLIV